MNKYDKLIKTVRQVCLKKRYKHMDRWHYWNSRSLLSFMRPVLIPTSIDILSNIRV